MIFFIALILAALSGMGVGGGGLFALYLKLFTDYPQIKVQALNLLFFMCACVAALCVHLQREVADRELIFEESMDGEDSVTDLDELVQ